MAATGSQSCPQPLAKPRTPMFLIIWLGIAAIFIASHFSFYFLESHYEGGDFAANALQIREAKAFRELQGNYSRFRFHHPGPAFFYVYALGEAVLFDTLKIVPTPHNAHAITGIFLQAFFFTWALVIVGRRVRQTLLLPLMLVFAGAHFSIVNYYIPGSAFESIWPPYVLLCPFLCFLVACASLASGEVEDLVPCVLAGSFLVHGHVSQPLFVLPLFAVSYLAFRLRPSQGKNPPGVRGALYYHLCATAVLAVFLIPLVVDAYKGKESNLWQILQHLSQHAEGRKTLSQSLVYLAAFFYYVANPQQYCDQLILSNLNFLVDRSPFLWMWILIAIVALVAQKTTQPDERHFFRWLWIIFAIALLLSVVWAGMQHHEMFGFNAYFCFALLFVPFICLAIVIAFGVKRRWTRYLRPALYIAAAILAVATARGWRWHTYLPAAPAGTEAMVDLVRQAAVADRQGSKTKFLSFEHEAWEWAAGAALALERFGYGYAVPAQWSFIFGAKHVVEWPAALHRGEVALWRIVSPALPGNEWLSNSVPGIDPAQGEITFSGTEVNAQAFVIGGWGISNGPFSWSTQRTALLYFQALPASADVQIDFHVFPFTFSTNRIQRMSVSFNNEPPQVFEVAHSGIQSMRVPLEVWNRRPCATLAFEFPNAISPKAVGESADERLLGCGFTRIVFHSFDATSTSVPGPETQPGGSNALAVESKMTAANMLTFRNDN